MSREALSRFLKEAFENPELQSKLIEFAAKQGFEFTADELSDADLDTIAGGPSRRVHDFIAAEQLDQLESMKTTPTDIDPMIP